MRKERGGCKTRTDIDVDDKGTNGWSARRQKKGGSKPKRHILTREETATKEGQRNSILVARDHSSLGPSQSIIFILNLFEELTWYIPKVRMINCNMVFPKSPKMTQRFQWAATWKWFCPQGSLDGSVIQKIACKCTDGCKKTRSVDMKPLQGFIAPDSVWNHCTYHLSSIGLYQCYKTNMTAKKVTIFYELTSGSIPFLHSKIVTG